MNTPNPTPDPLPLIYTDPVVQVEVRVQEYPYGRGRPGAGVQFTLSNGRDVIAARLPEESARGLARSILAAVDPAESAVGPPVVSTEGSGHPQPAGRVHGLSRNGRMSVRCAYEQDGCDDQSCACFCHCTPEGDTDANH